MLSSPKAILISLTMHSLLFIPWTVERDMSKKSQSRVSVTLVKGERPLNKTPLKTISKRSKKEQKVRKNKHQKLRRFNSIVKNYSPPPYPLIAIRKGIEGEVLIKLSINSQGQVNQVILLQSSKSTVLDQSVIKTAKNWTFETTRPLQFQKRIVFRLD
ncbi:MAG: energy transducer TonB [Bacteriovoracaceae bacterium]|jgi:TonB family protein|nr:energy transducer TonB [Bacteriovoracaceae bacterium]